MPSESHSGASDIQASLAADVGLRGDNLDWNIAGNVNGSNPNILSELTWKNIESYQYRLSGRVDIGRWIRIRSAIAYATIYSGKNQDSDYDGDNRTDEFSRSNNNSDHGRLWDANIGFGPRFDFGLDYFRLIPMAGYSYHVQHLTMTDGYQTIDTVGEPDLGPFAGLDSSYESRWQGPFLGINMEINAQQPLWVFEAVTLNLYLEHHWANYNAKADWNLRTDYQHPVSFRHSADGTGLIYGLGAAFYFNPKLALSMALDASRWETDEGTDRVFLTSGAVGYTRLNRVRWDSKTFSLGMTYHF